MKITQERFIKTLQTGSCWSPDDIRDEINRLLENKNHRWTNHYFQRDHIDKYWYIYDNECYLFVEDEKITVRCDRDNVSSSGMTHTIHIENKRDIELAYDEFRMMTMEDDDTEE